MVAFTMFEGFPGYLGLSQMNFQTDLIKVFLTNSAVSASADDVFTDLTDLTTTGGYTATGEDTTNTYAEVTGTGTITVVDVVWNATGGGFGPFQSVIAYNDTHASKILIGWWDNGSALTLVAGESFTVDFAADSLLTIA